MDIIKKILAEENFAGQLLTCGMPGVEDIAGKTCLIICGIGGVGLARKIFANAFAEQLGLLGAAKCDRVVLFNSDDLDAYYDLTDVEDIVGSSVYDAVFILGGLEKTRQIGEGVRQVQAVCRIGGKIFAVARTPKVISARRLLDSYEDVWRYEADDFSALFQGSAVDATACDPSGEIVAVLLTRNQDVYAAKPCSLYHVRNGKRIDIDTEKKEGYFHAITQLDDIGIKCHTDKCGMAHNYLDKYEFFLRSFRDQPIRLLELGVFQGASLRMWKTYFPRGEIFGVDIGEDVGKYEEERIHIIQADLSNAAQLTRLGEIQPQIIIDDASHIVSHQILALFTLFEILPHGGVYIVEDLETSLNPEQFEDAYRDLPLNAYDVCARIARVTARKVPDDDSIYANQINRIGMATELVSIMMGSVVLIKR